MTYATISLIGSISFSEIGEKNLQGGEKKNIRKNDELSEFRAAAVCLFTQHMNHEEIVDYSECTKLLTASDR